MKYSNNPIWLCEYSGSQNRVHVVSLDTAVEQNRRQVLEGEAGDWIPVAAFDTIEKANAMASLLEQEVVIPKMGNGQ